MMNITTITNGLVVNHDAVFPADVILEGNTIAELRRPGSIDAKGESVLDASGMLVLPGVIDVHFHCRAPAFPQRGDFASESRAAAAGGVTSIFEMPISKPGASTVAIWDARRVLVERDAHVNVGLYGAPGLLDAAEIEGMAAAGAIGFKFFTTRAPAGREDEFEGLIAESMSQIAEALRLMKPTGLRCVFHAEDQSLIDWYTVEARAANIPDFKRHAQSRPPVVEASMAASLVTLAKAIDTPIHIAHVSSAATVDVVRYARAIHAPVTAETCPHYLYFTDDALEKVGPFGKINPPIRAEADRVALWQAIEDGTLDLIATDHAPFTAAEKDATWDNILDAPPGHPGIEALVPLVMTEALQGRFSLSKAILLISTTPARLYNLYPQRGIVLPGSEADITIYDPRPETQLNRAEWFSRAAESNRLYDGMRVQGRVHATIVGGQLVYREGEIRNQPGDGKVLRPFNSS